MQQREWQQVQVESLRRRSQDMESQLQELLDQREEDRVTRRQKEEDEEDEAHRLALGSGHARGDELLRLQPMLGDESGPNEASDGGAPASTRREPGRWRVVGIYETQYYTVHSVSTTTLTWPELLACGS